MRQDGTLFLGVTIVMVSWVIAIIFTTLLLPNVSILITFKVKPLDPSILKSFITSPDEPMVHSLLGVLIKGGQHGLGHNNNKHTPQPLLDPLERSFRKGHQRLNSNAFFSSTSVDPTSRFLSGYVLQPIESDLSRTQPTTTGLKNNPNN